MCNETEKLISGYFAVERGVTNRGFSFDMMELALGAVEQRTEVQNVLMVQWAAASLLTRQFAVTLVQLCPNGAHDLKSVFFSDFDAYLGSLGHGEKESLTAKQRWRALATHRKEAIGIVAGVLESTHSGGFVAKEEERGVAEASERGLTNHLRAFGNVASLMNTKVSARRLVALDSFSFVTRCVALLDRLGLLNGITICHLELDLLNNALRQRHMDGIGLRAPFVSESERANLIKFLENGACSAGTDYFQRLRLLAWEREIRERWFLLRNVSAIEGQIHFFSNETILSFSLLDLFLGCSQLQRGDSAASFDKSKKSRDVVAISGSSNVALLRWHQLVEFLGDCANAGGDNQDQAHATPSDGVVRAMVEQVEMIPLPIMSRSATVIPWLERGLLLSHEIDRSENEHISFFDASVMRPNRDISWPPAHGRISHMCVADSINALIIATFDVVRVIDGDNSVCKVQLRVDDPITVVQWIASLHMMVVGTRAGAVHCFALELLDSWFFGGGSHMLRELPASAVRCQTKLHTDAITHIASTCLPSSTIVVCGMDSHMSCWSLDSNVTRTMRGLVALSFELVPSLGLVFGHGVELFPFVWAYTVATAKPTAVGGVKKGCKPHQGRIIGTAVLNFPKNAGVSVDRLGGIMVWDLWESALLQSWSLIDQIPATISSHGTTFSKIFLSDKSDKIFAVSNKFIGQIQLLKQEDQLRAPIASNSPVQCLTYCPELRIFISAQRNTLTIWNAVTASPVTSFENISPSRNDEICVVKALEVQRELRVGTRLGYVITLALGNGATKSVYQHPSRRDVQCILYINALEILVMSCEMSAKSIMKGEEKSFSVPGQRSIGFSDVCLHKEMGLLVAAHDREPRCTVWDISPSTPNFWVRLCDATMPSSCLDLTLAAKMNESAVSAVAMISFTRLEDFFGTSLFAISDSTSRVFVCEIVVHQSVQDHLATFVASKINCATHL